jgi:Flp pilus assembly pilin Flp
LWYHVVQGKATGFDLVEGANRMSAYLPYLRARFAGLMGDRTGTVSIEYILVAGLIALGFIVAATGLATTISDQLTAIGTYLTTNVAPG